MLLALTWIDALIGFLLRVLRGVFGSELDAPVKTHPPLPTHLPPVIEDKPDPMPEPPPPPPIIHPEPDPTPPVISEKWKPKLIDMRGAFVRDGKNYPLRSLSKLKWFVVHHTAAKTQNPAEIDAMHKKRGWVKVGYHYLINLSGDIFWVNDLSRNTNSVENHNTSVISVAVMGNMSIDAPPEAVLKSIAWLYENTKTPHPLALAEHRDFKATECPGLNFNIEMVKKYLTKQA